MDKKQIVIIFLTIGCILGIVWIAMRTPKTIPPKETPTIEVPVPKVEYEVYEDGKG